MGIISPRTKHITKHIALSFIYKGGSIAANLLLVPLTINYLDTTNYGVWLILTTFISWFTFFDIGLGHGLRNRFVESKAKGDDKLVRGYISSAYFTLGFISICLIILFFLINYFIDWTKVFNTNINMKEELRIIMFIVFSFFCIQLVAKLITTIYTADQRPSIQGLINFLTQIILLTTIWIITKTSESSLLLFALLFSSLPLIILIAFNLYSFNNKYRKYKPSIFLWKKEYLRNIFGLGMKFFIIQIAAIILYSTDNIIITQLFSPDDVVPYNLAFKYFSIATIVYTTIVTPYWSAITEAYVKSDFTWIKKSMKNLSKISLLVTIGIILLLIVSENFYLLWVGNKVKVPFILSIFMALLMIIRVFAMPYTSFINGVGKIKVQIVLGVSVAIINIPLSIIFAKHFNFGISGVILATVVCNSAALFVAPLQYSKIISNRANGIWNK